MNSPSLAREPSLTLATSLANRVCHDIAGLLGTLAGTLEMAADDPEAASLAHETAETLKHRIRLLRAAWGSNDGALSAAEISDLARGLPGIERLRVDVSDVSCELPAALAQLTLCLLLAAPHMRSGTIHIAASGNFVQVTLPVAWPALFARCAAGGADCWQAAESARELAGPLACLIAASLGQQIAVEATTARIERSK